MNEYCQGVVFSERAYNYIITESFYKNPLETGGILLGHILDNGVWLVMEVLPPGPGSIFQMTYFEYDTDFVNYLAQSIASQYNIKLSLLGLWHRHPGSMDTFSRTDDETNRTYAKLNPRGALSGLVNIDPNFRLTIYHVHPENHSYTGIEIAVGDEIIPSQYFKLKYYPDNKLESTHLNTANSTREALYKQEIDEVKELISDIQTTENNNSLNIKFTHNYNWRLELRYSHEYTGHSSELRMYIDNYNLKYILPTLSLFPPYVITNNNGELYLNIEEIFGDIKITGKEVIKQSIKWIDLYEKFRANLINIDEFTL